MIKKILLIVTMVLILSNIYAASTCWSRITCSGVSIPTGSIIAKDWTSASISTVNEEYCVINAINPAASGTSEILIEINYGSYNNAPKKLELLFNRDDDRQDVEFLLSRSTSPVDIICYSVNLSPGVGIDYAKLKTIQYFTMSYNGLWYSQIDTVKKPNYFFVNSYLANLGTTVFDVNNTHTADIDKKYQNLPADSSNPFIMGLGYLLLAFGIFLSFTFVFQLFKRR